MLINLDNFRKTKQQNPTNTIQMTKVPVFERIFVENNKLVGEIKGGKDKVVIEEFKKATH